MMKICRCQLHVWVGSLQYCLVNYNKKVEDHWSRTVLEGRGGGWWRPH